jgi:hypothetical protein
MTSGEVDSRLMLLWMVLCIGVGLLLSKEFNIIDLALTLALVALSYVALGMSGEESLKEGPANPFRDPAGMGKNI